MLVPSILSFISILPIVMTESHTGDLSKHYLRTLQSWSLNTSAGILITGGYGEVPEISRTSAEIFLSVEVSFNRSGAKTVRGEAFFYFCQYLSIHSVFKNVSIYCVFCLHNWSEMQDWGRLFDKYWLSTPDNQISCLHVLCQGDLFQCELPDLPQARYSHTQDGLTGTVTWRPSHWHWCQPLIGHTRKITNSQVTAWLCQPVAATPERTASLWTPHQDSGGREVNTVSDLWLVRPHNTDLWLADLCDLGLQGDLGPSDPSLLSRVLGQRPGEPSVVSCVSDCWQLFNW